MGRLFRNVVYGLVILGGGARAQTDTPLKFEVASIKPAAPDARGTMVRPGPGGGLRITNMTLKEMIVFAYRIQPFQISGGPGWLDSAHYDITAKAETKPKGTEIQQMLQALLAERFQLSIRRESKELPVYALVVARPDGKLGPKLIEAKEGSCTPPDPTRPPPPREPGKPPELRCGMMMMGRSQLTAVSIPLENLVPMLSRYLGRTVMDKTGLAAKYDVSLEWTPDETQAMGSPLESRRPEEGRPPEVAGPSLFTAVHEQLGLKLEPQKGPVEIFVVERAERPSEN